MKTGLVLEGGANRTLFSCGVMDAFLDYDLMFDYIIGVSAGAAWGASYVSRQKLRNKMIVDEYMNDRRYMGINNFFRKKNRSYYGLDFVYNQIPNKLIPFDYVAYRNNPCEFFAVVTNLYTGKPEYLELNRNDISNRILIATCALPFMFPIVEIDGKPYMDGGISDSIPYEKALADGCDRVVVVLTRQADYRKSTEPISHLINVFYRKYPAFCEAMKQRTENYNNCLDRLAKAEKNGDILVIRPEHIADVSRTERDLSKLNRIYNEGYSYADKHFKEIADYLK